MTQPLVSIVVPVYNGEKYLDAALKSIFAQDYQPIDVIVIDDGSVDGSAKIAKSFKKARYTYQNHQGAAVARNLGISQTKGELIAFLDADDIWLPDKLTLQMAAFDSNQELDMVFGQVQQFISPELDERAKAAVKGDKKIMSGICADTLLIKRESFLRTGYFPTQWHVGEFIDWYLKAMEAGLKSSEIGQVVTKRRLHDANTGIYKRDFRIDYVRIVKASLDRRRSW